MCLFTKGMIALWFFLEIRKPPTMRLDAEVKKFFFSWLEMKYVAHKIWIKTKYFLKRTQS